MTKLIGKARLEKMRAEGWLSGTEAIEVLEALAEAMSMLQTHPAAHVERAIIEAERK